jgi:7-carboxy-7-deazaguanine synthase
MRIAEIFRSIQGEGRLTGTESVFVRTSGCNLRCDYCDTPYASWSPEGQDFSVTEILDRIEQLRPTNSKPHAVLTGGEPMLSADLIPLSTALRQNGWHITIETSGTLYLAVACDLMSISPKLSNSTPPLERDPHWNQRHAQVRHAPDVIRRLTTDYDYQLKFVIDTAEDCREVETYLGEFPEIDRRRVMLMPQGIDAKALAEKTAWLAPYCDRHGFQLCPRRQIEWFGSERGK